MSLPRARAYPCRGLNSPCGKGLRINCRAAEVANDESAPASCLVLSAGTADPLAPPPTVGRTRSSVGIHHDSSHDVPYLHRHRRLPASTCAVSPHVDRPARVHQPTTLNRQTAGQGRHRFDTLTTVERDPGTTGVPRRTPCRVHRSSHRESTPNSLQRLREHIEPAAHTRPGDFGVSNGLRLSLTFLRGTRFLKVMKENKIVGSKNCSRKDKE